MKIKKRKIMKKINQKMKQKKKIKLNQYNKN